MENSWVLPKKQNQIAVVGRTFTSPPLIANRYELKLYEILINRIYHLTIIQLQLCRKSRTKTKSPLFK